MFEKLVLVTRRTRLDGLIERFNTKGQAKFYLQQAGLDFADYEREHDTYSRSLEKTRAQVEKSGLKVQVLDRAVVPTYLFAPTDLVVALGQDGLVANTAKYVGAQPLIGVNPDPERFDGVLLPFRVDEVRQAVDATVSQRAVIDEVTLAEAKLSDGQRLLAFNDLYIGARTHVSSQYRLNIGKSGWVRHSSSGVIVSTGAGSTGWLSSVFAMARALGGTVTPVNLERSDRKLYFVVREPFASKQSTVAESFGVVNAERVLQLESLMPSGGVIFSDGMEDDALLFTSGLVATIGPADQRARLVARG
ncbi:MAG: NAD+ kinase [Archangium gephyra]|uniref:NAD+ kinase n=1 Tax=Archangium gephyra TaxID=48 RepID=A0A2W5VL02_9BACT|nr:MAG: NAD+ kinase [Archangium gephyra]